MLTDWMLGCVKEGLSVRLLASTDERMELLQGRERQEPPRVSVCVYTILSLGSSLQSLRYL